MTDSIKEALLVIDDIKSSFVNLPYPGDDNIVPLNASGPEFSLVKKAFERRSWIDIVKEDDFVSFYYDALLLLTPISFRFYLPAYMIKSISLLGEMVCQTTIRVLTPPPYGILSSSDYNENIAALDGNQLRSIRMFMQFMYKRGYLDEDAGSILGLESQTGDRS